jgi:hypothetical protein
VRKLISIALIGAMLSACATAPSKIQANYVSPLQYSNLDCDQLRAELYRVAGQVRVVTGEQARKANSDAWALGIGLVVFWPALFFMMTPDQREELAELKGEYEALDYAAIERKCPVADEVRSARSQAEQVARAHGQSPSETQASAPPPTGVATQTMPPPAPKQKPCNGLSTPGDPSALTCN